MSKYLKTKGEVKWILSKLTACKSLFYVWEEESEILDIVRVSFYFIVQGYDTHCTAQMKAPRQMFPFQMIYFSPGL